MGPVVVNGVGFWLLGSPTGVFGIGTVPDGTTVSLRIPNAPSLRGLPFVIQASVVDASAAPALTNAHFGEFY